MLRVKQIYCPQRLRVSLRCFAVGFSLGLLPEFLFLTTKNSKSDPELQEGPARSAGKSRRDLSALRGTSRVPTPQASGLKVPFLSQIFYPPAVHVSSAPQQTSLR